MCNACGIPHDGTLNETWRAITRAARSNQVMQGPAEARRALAVAQRQRRVTPSTKQSPFTRRARAGVLPTADLTGHEGPVV